MNRRESARASRRLRAQYWARKTEERRFHAYTKDVSEGGVYIVTNQPYRKGSRIRLELGEGEERFVAEGSVVRSKAIPRQLQKVTTGGMAIRFLSILEPASGAEPVPESSGLISVPRSIAFTSDDGHLIRYDRREEFLAAYEIELSKGHLVVPAHSPASVGEEVEIVLEVGGAKHPLRLPATVHEVHANGNDDPEGVALKVSISEAARVEVDRLFEAVEAEFLASLED